jgi:hypothetical protein
MAVTIIKKSKKIPASGVYTFGVSSVQSQVMDVYNKEGNKVSAIKKLRELTGISLKEAKNTVESWILCDFIDTTTEPDSVPVNLQASPVPLKDAQQLNQPVCGTSGGSIYHVIAIGPSCVVAARIRQDNSVALRAEILCKGSKALEARSGLKFAGLDQKPAGHFSLHLEPADFGMVKRTIGSTLMAMSIPFSGVTTDLHPLHGLGK